MKRILIPILLFLLLLTVPSASAHPGRTDSNGGHTDSSTGEYHYHHGYPAHQHYDMDGDGKKDCPYEFKDKTGSTSGTSSKSSFSSSSSSTSGLTTLAYTSSAKTNPSSDSISVFLLLVILFFIFHAIVHSSRKRTLEDLSDRLFHAEQAYQNQLLQCQKYAQAEKEYQDALNKYAESEQKYRAVLAESEKKYQDALAESKKNYQEALAESEKLHMLSRSTLDACRNDFANYSSQANKALTDRVNELNASLNQSRRNQSELLLALRQTYGKDFLLPASGAPSNAYLDSHGLPRLNASDRTDPYMLHRSSTGKFHAPGCSHSGICTHIHALNVSPLEFKKNRCMFCNPEYPDISWYAKYRHLVDITKNEK